MSQCRCGLSDIGNLRQALGWSKTETCERLAIHRSTLWWAERQPHRCLKPSTVRLLRAYLATPECQAALRAAGYPHPFPEDLNAAPAQRRSA